MSRAKDRARAEAGMVYRDGKLVNKEEWAASHPRVGACAVKPESPPDVCEEESRSVYFCSKCNRNHRPGSGVYEQHRSYDRQLPG